MSQCFGASTLIMWIGLREDTDVLRRKKRLQSVFERTARTDIRDNHIR